MPTPFTFHFFRNLYAAALALGMPVLRRHQRNRIKLGKEDPDRILEREGVSSTPRPDGDVMWIHGASVGEALATLPVIEEILAERKDTWVLLTTGTVTSAEILKSRLPQRTIHQFAPLDRPGWISTFLDHWRPGMAVWVESEFWPNTLWAIHQRSIPLVLLNGRISSRSYHRWQRVPGFVKGLLSCFTLCLAQSAEDAARLQTLGANPVKDTGNIKLGAPPLPYDAEQFTSMQDAIGDRSRWLLSSTHAGEEQMAANIHQAIATEVPDLLTIIVPRHPDRGHEVSTMLRDQGLVVSQRSSDQLISSETQIYVADTIGELGLFYHLCPIVFMGKSLIAPGGGQNPFEAARIGCSVLFGPYMANFVDLSANMIKSNAAKQVAHEGELTNEVRNRLSDPGVVADSIQAAQIFCSQSETAIPDSVNEILKAWPDTVEK
jgi:3-deoxy-D-manno-octulosonic-acid transferase